MAAYEIVRAVDVVVGDVVVADPSLHPMRIDRKLDTGSIAINGGVRMWCEPIFRQLPPERNPDVLMRALRNELIDVAAQLGYDVTDLDAMVQECIDVAIRELESEGRDGSQGSI